MKKYVYEADKKQLEKPTEPKYVFCGPARVTVFAESEAEGRLLAGELLRQEFNGSGVELDALRLAKEHTLPVDWNYGYGADRKSGTPADMDELIAQSVIR